MSHQQSYKLSLQNGLISSLHSVKSTISPFEAHLMTFTSKLFTVYISYQIVKHVWCILYCTYLGSHNLPTCISFRTHLDFKLHHTWKRFCRFVKLNFSNLSRSYSDPVLIDIFILCSVFLAYTILYQYQ